MATESRVKRKNTRDTYYKVKDSVGVCLPLSNTTRCAMVDEDDAKKLQTFRWHEHGGYACRTIGSGRRAKRECIHRIVTDAPSGVVVDHIDGDSLNNTKINLRVANKRQNMANTSKLKNNKSGLKGVVKRGKRYRSYIHDNGKTIYLGSFTTPEKAACEYDKKAKALFGEFARLNGAC